MGTRGISFNSKLLGQSCGILGALARSGEKVSRNLGNGSTALALCGNCIRLAPSSLLLEPLRGPQEASSGSLSGLNYSLR